MSCSKSKVENQIPGCISYKIEVFKTSSMCADAHVDRYLFQNKSVFVFEEGSCGADFSANVYDVNCQLLGSLGGFAGNLMINGENFSTAIFEKTVWKK
jgi:hypothetical protein